MERFPSDFGLEGLSFSGVVPLLVDCWLMARKSPADEWCRDMASGFLFENEFESKFIKIYLFDASSFKKFY